MAGAAWYQSGAQLAVMPSGKTGVLFLLPGLQHTADQVTEIYLANPSTEDAEVHIALVNPDGTQQDSYDTVIGPGGSETARVSLAFPNLSVASGQPEQAAVGEPAGMTAVPPEP